MVAEIRLCTLFDSKFLTQGLALIESVRNNTDVLIKWSVLALDTITFDTITSKCNPTIEVISIDEFNDQELQNLRANRPWREFCWTSAACLLKYCIENAPTGQKIAYIDADCFFFSDISKMLENLKYPKSIAIHEHRFSEDRIDWLAKSGRFNVGVVAGIKDSDFLKCISRWRRQVIERCDVAPAESRCGDQTYLNEWPSLYESLLIMNESGVGLAPWNIQNYKVRQFTKSIYVDQFPLYFFHFHGLQIGYISRFFAIFVSASGYALPLKEHEVIYNNYIRALMRQIPKLGTKPKNSLSFGWLIRSLLNKSLKVCFIR